MAYAFTNKKGQTYFLHQQEVQLRGNNRQQTIYFFALKTKTGPKVKALDAIPDGWTVADDNPSGMPVLKRAKK
jgi:hypothetical protein